MQLRYISSSIDNYFSRRTVFGMVEHNESYKRGYHGSAQSQLFILLCLIL